MENWKDHSSFKQQQVLYTTSKFTEDKFFNTVILRHRECLEAYLKYESTGNRVDYDQYLVCEGCFIGSNLCFLETYGYVAVSMQDIPRLRLK